VKDCPPLKKRELEEWIRERVRLHGLPPPVAATVGRATNPNLGVIESELLKLAAYQAGGAKLDQAALADLLVGDRQEDIFRLTDNLLPSATPAAWRALDSLLQTESPTGIAYRIARHVSLVLEVGTHRSQGLSLAAVQGQMREHPYVIQKAYELGARVSLEGLEGSLGALLDYEWRVKSGQIDADWGLRSLLAQL
ncbi:MAG: DNA polymerase III subunit delta, partial [Candidatus Dormibacteraceae bacterium]